MLALPLTNQRFNAIMLVTCKFLKQVILVESADTWSAEQWALAFLKQLDLIDWGLSGKLITNQDLKFLSKFWAELFAKLGVKLLHSMAYHPQTDGSSKCTNQTVEIALRFFVYVLENPFLWPKMLPHIQCILNNTSSLTTDNTPNKVAYGFSPHKPLNLLSNSLFLNTFQVCTDVADTISFAFANQKAHYN